MPYDEDFFTAYRAYLEEPSVRAAHSTAFRTFQAHFDQHETRGMVPSVIDLGCGQAHEFRNYADWDMYLGVDLDPGPETGNFLMRADYRSAEFLQMIGGHEVTAELDTFVSLFSAECSAPYRENMSFYEGVFEKIPQLQFGLVAGFYYPSQKHLAKVGEAGGIESWQTLEPIENGRSEVFDEFRLAIPCPSSMFGAEVIEVWRIFTAKDRVVRRVPSP